MLFPLEKRYRCETYPIEFISLSKVLHCENYPIWKLRRIIRFRWRREAYTQWKTVWNLTGVMETLSSLTIKSIGSRWILWLVDMKQKIRMKSRNIENWGFEKTKIKIFLLTDEELRKEHVSITVDGRWNPATIGSHTPHRT